MPRDDDHDDEDDDDYDAHDAHDAHDDDDDDDAHADAHADDKLLLCCSLAAHPNGGANVN